MIRAAPSQVVRMLRSAESAKMLAVNISTTFSRTYLMVLTISPHRIRYLRLLNCSATVHRGPPRKVVATKRVAGSLGLSWQGRNH